MPVEELSQRLQRYAQKVVRDRAYVAPEVEDAWLESKIVEGLLQIDRAVAQRVVDLEEAYNSARRDLLRSGNANMPPATAFPFFKTFDVRTVLAWVSRPTRDLGALLLSGPPGSGKTLLAEALKELTTAPLKVLDEVASAPDALNTIYTSNTVVGWNTSVEKVRLSNESAIALAKLGQHLCGSPLPILVRDLVWLRDEVR